MTIKHGKETSMTPKQVSNVNKIGLIWSVQSLEESHKVDTRATDTICESAQWISKYSNLKDYKLVHGH